MRKNPHKCDIRDKEILTIEETAALTGIGQQKIREMLDEPDCPFLLQNGKKRMVFRSDFLDYLKSKRSI